jgi:D-arabinose 1-dehydrogenase-like Zn-dependent alcohol dehydrogenase
MALKVHGEKNDVVKAKAAVLGEPSHIALIEKPIPDVAALDALIRLATTTICDTDVCTLEGHRAPTPTLHSLAPCHPPLARGRERHGPRA